MSTWRFRHYPLALAVNSAHLCAPHPRIRTQRGITLADVPKGRYCSRALPFVIDVPCVHYHVSPACGGDRPLVLPALGSQRRIPDRDAR
jgi:hypothetical protein